MLSTLALAPLPLSNNASDLARVLDYAQSHGHPDLELATGTEDFTPSLIGLLPFGF